MRARRNVERVAVCTLVLTACAAAAQNDDVPLPPRLGQDAEPSTAVPPIRVRVPDRARLAPLPEERGAAPDEIVVIGGTQWRLPDLGSAWREDREAEDSEARIQATLLPLYDPENPPQRSDLFLLNREQQRVGYIELFRIRFGGRSRD